MVGAFVAHQQAQQQGAEQVEEDQHIGLDHGEGPEAGEGVESGHGAVVESNGVESFCAHGAGLPSWACSDVKIKANKPWML